VRHLTSGAADTVEAQAWTSAFGALGVQPVAEQAAAEPVWVVEGS